MSNAVQIALGEVWIFFLWIIFDVTGERAMFGKRFSWRSRGPVIFGLRLPSVLIAILTVDAYLAIPAGTGLRWLAIVGGVGIWILFLWLRHRFLARRRAGQPKPGPWWPRLKAELRQMPRTRLVVYVVVCFWAVACIVGGLLTFVK